MENKIVFVLAGGTLGHINPALVISEMFYLDNYKVYFISSEKFAKTNYFDDKNYLSKVYYLPSQGLSRGSLFKNIRSFVLNVKVYRKIKSLIKEYQPKFILGMGGSISTLGILAGSSFKIPMAIHEQNAIMGLGNKIVLNKVDKVFTGYDYEKENMLFVGNPLESISYSKRKITKSRNILVFGGSNGSTFMNDFIIDNIDIFTKYNIERVYLIVGRKYYEKNKEKISIAYKNCSYLEIISETNQMDKYYNNSFLVITRGGAGTISEIIGYKKLALVIPSPNVTNNHQYYNALFFKKKNCLELIEEKNLSRENFIVSLEKLVNNNKLYYKSIDENNHYFSKYIMYDEITKLMEVKSNE